MPRLQKSLGCMNIILRMGDLHAICDHWENVSGCWSARLVCGVRRDFRRIHHCCDGSPQIQSYWQYSHDYVRGDIDASPGVLLRIHSNHGAEVHHLEEALKSISTFHDEVSQTPFTALMDDASRSRILLLFKEYLCTIRNGNRLRAFWTTYLDMAEIMLGLLLSTRYGDWLLHFPSIRAMIPLCYAHDKDRIMHASCHTTIPQCQAFPLTTMRCTKRSCKMVSVTSLVTKITSAASMWIKSSMIPRYIHIRRHKGFQSEACCCGEVPSHF